MSPFHAEQQQNTADSRACSKYLAFWVQFSGPSMCSALCRLHSTWQRRTHRRPARDSKKKRGHCCKLGCFLRQFYFLFFPSPSSLSLHSLAAKVSVLFPREPSSRAQLTNSMHFYQVSTPVTNRYQHFHRSSASKPAFKK